MSSLTLVQILVGIVWVVDNHWASQAIAVLCTKMGVVPKGTSMVSSSEPVSESMSRRDRALTDALRPIRRGRSMLKQAVPVLELQSQRRRPSNEMNGGKM